MHQNKVVTEKEPGTDTVPKAIKKSFINWIVPTLCIALVMACFLVVQNWADGRYITRVNSDRQADDFRAQLADRAKKQEELDRSVQSLDRKLDLILYIMQRDGKIDAGTMKQPKP